MEAIAYNAEMGVPVEMNESHQWALRYCSDVIEVAISVITAKVAKHLGVKEMVMQYMLANPPSISPIMDLAKMQAKIDPVKLMEDFFAAYEFLAGHEGVEAGGVVGGVFELLGDAAGSVG